MTGSAALSPACFALSDSSSSSALEVDSPTLPSSQISPLPSSAGPPPPCAQPKVASSPGGAPPLQLTLVELGHSTSGFFADLALASGFSYAFFSFGDSSASASLCHEDAFSALLRCAFSGVVSVMVAHVFDLEAGPLGDRLLHRLCQLLLATFLGGGHILLFMHSASGLWTQRATRSLLLEARAALTILPLCGFGSTCHDELLLASSLECFGSLAGTCRHAGSASTSAFSLPPALCQGIISLLCRSSSSSGSPALLSLDALVTLRPVKQAGDLPIASQDGGGIHSKPDWSVPPSSASGIFSQLRKDFLTFILQHGLHKRLRDHVAAASDSPFFSDKEVLAFRGIANRWFDAQGCRDEVNWEKPSGQPYCLHALHSLSQVVKDADKHLFLALLEGVPTGYDGDVPKSNVFASQDSTPSDGELLLCFGNWTGAEADPALLCELLQKEVDAGWLEAIPLHEAQARWGSRVAVGRLNIVIAPGKKPRLVVDSSVCGTNSCCQVPESYALPGLQHVRFSFPFRMHNGALAGFSLDIEAAHKTVRVRERDRGLLGVQHPLPDGTLRYLFYRVCPFGAVFSAHWFQRISAFLIRMLHPFLYVRRALFMYSDDLLGITEQSVLEITFALVLSFCVCFGYPISWKKLQMGPRILWIGWSFHFGAGGVEVPSDKTSKLLTGLREILKSDRVDKRELHRVIGLIQWILQLFPLLKPWMNTLYCDLHSPLGSNYSMDPGDFPSIASFLDDALTFTSRPSGTAIPLGSKLLSVRHVDIKRKSDLAQVPLTSKRLWLRVADPASSRRRLSAASKQFLLYWKHWAEDPPLLRPLQIPLASPVEAAADAMASSNKFAIGGYVKMPSGNLLWFSQSWVMADMQFTKLELSDDAQSYIASFETLAQIALLHCASAMIPFGRLRIRIKSWCDNAGAESVSNKLYTRKYPLCIFAQRLALFSAYSSMSLDVSHIPGEYNKDADMLSRTSSRRDDHFILLVEIFCLKN